MKDIILFLIVALFLNSCSEVDKELQRSRTSYEDYYITVVRRQDAVIPSGWGSLSVVYLTYSDGTVAEHYAGRQEYLRQVGDAIRGSIKTWFAILVKKEQINENKVKLIYDDHGSDIIGKDNKVFWSSIGDTIWFKKPLPPHY